MFSFGRIDAAHKDCVPQNQVQRLFREARVFLLVYVAMAVWAVYIHSWWPLLMFLLPRIAGAPVHGIMLATQHIGFGQNLYDHRQTTRTMEVNVLLRFIYWNMNYHVEHHMFPNVPFHALPALHQQIAHDLPPPTPGVLAALREMFDVVKRQQHNPHFTCPHSPA